jgi:type IV secretory pathway component VirB8
LLVGHPAERIEPEEEKPPIDPEVIARAYERERARRRMRQDRTRARKRAHLRFYVTMLILLVAVGVIAILVWHETHTLFGI